ncbi:MAG: threonine synthase [Bdellovibrionales bacterium]|nr:threonine synthase [Bdellovibrionales bacterium]
MSPVRWVSTRGGGGEVSLAEALERGLAPDGGLYVPESIPRVDLQAIPAQAGFPRIAESVLAPYLAGTPWEPYLAELCAEALNFPVPLRPIPGGPQLLELFHGPTAAFKDAGARFLARTLARQPRADGRVRTVLVATSGDTGGAVASAFHGLAGFQVAVLFPARGVSPLQRRQLTCWGGNVRSFAVDGSFDDCQRLVKGALASTTSAQGPALVSANSISLGRLLPQIAFYAAASLWHRARTGRGLNVIVPTGNLGNGVAACYAREMGFPLESVDLASNANRPVPDFVSTGKWTPRPSVPTLANAMDVGAPSNGERLSRLYPDLARLRAVVSARAVSDDEIRAEIRAAYAEWGVAVCPHTATGLHFWRASGAREDTAVAATAHPAKFEEVLRPESVPITAPPALASLLQRPVSEEKLAADPTALEKILVSMS